MPTTGQPPRQFTLRQPPYTYFHLSLRRLALTSLQPQESVDEITARTYLSSALQQYLGLTGTAISIDILKVQDCNVWIRVPQDDEVGVTASLSQWVGTKDLTWKIEQKGTWLGGVTGRGTGGRQLWEMGGEAQR
ncbi:hypothetical protein B0A52_06992 [Exophiala mesophila]|uniref:Ribonucleases P/MRP subunit Pop8-like domain-containing protein n=1 Tax=Exophiala mesophila TaxID=212818 RepID=A0A438N128_EXOME|nr:hypothetical protein B0A52_06992 [Exophiala mesophila]